MVNNSITDKNVLFKTYKLMCERINFCDGVVKNSKDIEQVKSFLFPKYICEKSEECIRNIWSVSLLPKRDIYEGKYNFSVRFLKSYTTEYINNMIEYSRNSLDSLYEEEPDSEFVVKIEADIMNFIDCLSEISKLENYAVDDVFQSNQ